MFGIKFIKFDAMTYVIQYKKGHIKKEGKGLSFFYSARRSSIVAVPTGSNDIQFIFNETTSDFQTVSVQGQITYKIDKPKQLADILNYTVNYYGKLNTDDNEKLKQRLVNEAQSAATTFIQSMTLKDCIKNAKLIQEKITEGLSGADAVNSLGVSVMGVSVIAVKPTPEMSKALETTTREALQQEADAAIYERRNFAVEQERKIKESELNTEIAVQEKEKQIAEKRMEKEHLEEENSRKLREMRISADIAVEEKRKAYIDIKTENEKKEADSKKYGLNAQLEPYRNMDWKILTAMNSQGNTAKTDIAIAFREMAENAQVIQNLNITPDLLQSLTEK
jgi:hypothetical protein